MNYFNINKKMKYLTDKKLSLNAKGLLSIILFQEEINEDKLEKYCTDDNKTIKELEQRLTESTICERFNYSPKDILLKRDIDYISQLIYPEEYVERKDIWDYMSRENKAQIIMKYIDSIELSEAGSRRGIVSKVNFRESFLNSFNKLYNDGYLDRTKTILFKNEMELIRQSEYLSPNEVEEILARLRKFYKVSYMEAIFYGKEKAFAFNKVNEKYVIVRMFPLEKEKIPETNKEKVKMGIIYIKENDVIFYKDKEQIDKLFNYIPGEKDNELKCVNDKLMSKSEKSS